MPGYIIHLAIAKEYLRKNKKEVSKDFLEGTIAPDLTENKSKTHYGKSPAYTNIGEYLKQNNIENDYDKGFFLHLVADYLFYNKYLEKLEKPQIYKDYDYTNKSIIEKYNVEILDDVKEKVFFEEGTPINFTLNLLYKMIDEVSSLNLEEVKKEVKNNDIKWNTYKKLV